MTTIQWFINGILPTSEERSQISTSWWEIRNAIESKLDFIISSKLTWSYIRKTKISPIDDLDIIFKLSCWNSTYIWKDSDKNEARIHINEWYHNNHPLKNYTIYQDWKYYISPNKVLNKIKDRIQEKYSTTPDIKRNWECVTAYLSSYDLSIDCMPYAWIQNEEYILIPTSGNDLYWKKSNPKNDEDRINELNNETHFDWKLKWVIRIIKYWNKHRNYWVSLRSYLLECLVYRALRYESNYNLSYTEMLKIVISDIYNNSNRNILDIPWYDYIYFWLTDTQWDRIKWLLSDLRDKLEEWEDEFITYLKD